MKDVLELHLKEKQQILYIKQKQNNKLYVLKLEPLCCQRYYFVVSELMFYSNNKYSLNIM